MNKSIDYYKILGVSIFANDEEIKAGYLNKIKMYHPDAYKGNKAEAENITASINEAYSTLKDKNKKSVYDEKFGFDVQRQQILKERQKQKKKSKKKEHKNENNGEYTFEQQSKAKTEENLKTNSENKVNDKKIKTNFFTKKPKKDIKPIKKKVLTSDEKQNVMERRILDGIIIGLLLLVLIMLILKF